MPEGTLALPRAVTSLGMLPWNPARAGAAVICALTVLLIPGCALHYFDSKTGTEHVWGFGHMQMKAAAPNEGLQALIRRTDTLGLGLGRLEDQGYLTVGWGSRQRLDIIAEDTAIRLEWPDNDLFNVRVGSEFPAVFVQEETTDQNSPKEESQS